MPNRIKKRSCAILLIVGASWGAQAAESVACHVDYGGETQVLTATPSNTPYAIAPTTIGSYFLFRIVFETQPRELAAIKLYTYASSDNGPVPIHVANYPYPLPKQTGKYGFSGLQTVYEPLRDGELKYWCELRRDGNHK